MKNIFMTLVICFFATQICANSLDEIMQKGELKIGVRKDFPPLGSLNSGELDGFEVQLANEIGKVILKNGGKITLIPISGKDRIPMFQNNQIDLAIASMAVTPQREKEIDFSIPYLTTNMLIVSKKSDNIKNIGDFRGKTLLIISGTTSEEYINSEKMTFSDINIKTCESLQNCFKMLNNGEADGYFHAILTIAILPLLDNDYELSIPMIGSSDRVAVGVSKGNKELLEAVNSEILNLVKSDFFKNAYNDTFKVYYRGTLEKNIFC